MSYDEQAMRRVVEERTRWAAAFAKCQITFANTSSDALTKGVAILAAEMLRQLPQYFPESKPNEA